MEVSQDSFEKVNIGSTQIVEHPLCNLIIAIGSHFKSGIKSLWNFGRGEYPQNHLALHYIYNTQELDTRRICLPFSYQSNRKDYND